MSTNTNLKQEGKIMSWEEFMNEARRMKPSIPSEYKPIPTKFETLQHFTETELKKFYDPTIVGMFWNTEYGLSVRKSMENREEKGKGKEIMIPTNSLGPKMDRIFPYSLKYISWNHNNSTLQDPINNFVSIFENASLPTSVDFISYNAKSDIPHPLSWWINTWTASGDWGWHNVITDGVWLHRHYKITTNKNKSTMNLVPSPQMAIFTDIFSNTVSVTEKSSLLRVNNIISNPTKWIPWLKLLPNITLGKEFGSAASILLKLRFMLQSTFPLIGNAAYNGDLVQGALFPRVQHVMDVFHTHTEHQFAGNVIVRAKAMGLDKYVDFVLSSATMNFNGIQVNKDDIAFIPIRSYMAKMPGTLASWTMAFFGWPLKVWSFDGELRDLVGAIQVPDEDIVPAPFKFSVPGYYMKANVYVCYVLADIQNQDLDPIVDIRINNGAGAEIAIPLCVFNLPADANITISFTNDGNYGNLMDINGAITCWNQIYANDTDRKIVKSIMTETLIFRDTGCYQENGTIAIESHNGCPLPLAPSTPVVARLITANESQGIMFNETTPCVLLGDADYHRTPASLDIPAMNIDVMILLASPMYLNGSPNSIDEGDLFTYCGDIEQMALFRGLVMDHKLSTVGLLFHDYFNPADRSRSWVENELYREVSKKQNILLNYGLSDDFITVSSVHWNDYTHTEYWLSTPCRVPASYMVYFSEVMEILNMKLDRREPITYDPLVKRKFTGEGGLVPALKFDPERENEYSMLLRYLTAQTRLIIRPYLSGTDTAPVFVEAGDAMVYLITSNTTTTAYRVGYGLIVDTFVNTVNFPIKTYMPQGVAVHYRAIVVNLVNENFYVTYRSNGQYSQCPLIVDSMNSHTNEDF